RVLPACLLLALLLLAPALPAQHERGLIFNLEIGELCLQSAQCKSGCCHRANGLSLARCAPKAAEFQECSPRVGASLLPGLGGMGHVPHTALSPCSLQSIYEVYYKCPCERGLTCDADKTIVGSITNSNFGLCKDPQDSYRR
ncbi:COL Colipase, partial [Donacobius atricapilla]|nr:COL Colipase [Donacobius atricapilla]